MFLYFLLWACIVVSCSLAILAVGSIVTSAVMPLPTPSLWTPITDAPGTDPSPVSDDWNPIELASSVWKHRQLIGDAARWAASSDASIKNSPLPLQDWASRALAPFRSLKWLHNQS